MSDPAQKRHALTAFIIGQETPGPDNPNPGVQLEVRPDYGYLNLRGDPGDEQFPQAVQTTLGQSLPTSANTFTVGEHTIFWLGPDEWLLTTGLGREKETVEQLSKNLAGQCHSLVDVTGGQILIRLSGNRVREMLAKGCTLDLHPRTFKVGQCAQTTLAKTSILIALTDEAPTFDIIVRRSFAEYAAQWLQHSSARAG